MVTSERPDAGEVVTPERPDAGDVVTPRPRVDVIVPCYRYAHWLNGCVASVLTQRAVDVRVLIVDDCSPDDTPAVARALCIEDPRVEYLRHERNQGLIATANDGLEWARSSDYTVVLSADDQLTGGCLQRATAVMAQNPRVGLVYGWAKYAPTDQPLPAADGRWRATKVWRGEDWIQLRCRSGFNCISSPEVVVRTSTQRAVGLYDPACVHASDLNMWLRIAAVSDVAHIRGVPQAIYRIHADSMLRSDSSPLLSLRERRIAFESFFARYRSTLRGGAAKEQMARRALARQALWCASRTIDRGIAHASDRELVDDLVAFALEVCPETRHLTQWRGLQVRRALGTGRSAWFPPLLAAGAVHRLRGHLAMTRLRTKGV